MQCLRMPDQDHRWGHRFLEVFLQNQQVNEAADKSHPSWLSKILWLCMWGPDMSHDAGWREEWV